MIDPATAYQSKSARLATSGRSGIPMAEIGAGTACHMAMTGLAERITPETVNVVATAACRQRAQQAREWA